MTIKDHEESVADLFAQHSSISNNLWSVYAATTAVLMGLSLSRLVSETASDMTKPAEFWLRTAVTIGFSFFSWGNLQLLLDANRVLVSLRREIEALVNTDTSSGFHSTLSVVARAGRPLGYVYLYHLSIDLCVLASLWIPFVA